MVNKGINHARIFKKSKCRMALDNWREKEEKTIIEEDITEAVIVL